MGAEPLVALVGPTGAGKTRVALALADALPIEVLSLDSVQVYRGLDIGSAKPTAQEQARLRHHLIDLVDPDASFTAADYLAAFDQALAEVRARGRIPLVVGGTGLYLKLLSTGLATLPAADEALRRRLYDEETASPGALHARLAVVDPTSAARIAPRDRVRLVRALEVFELTGRPLSVELEAHAAAGGARRLEIVYLNPPDVVLQDALVARTDDMLRAGLVEEATSIRERFGAVRPLDSVGYKQVAELREGRFHPSELAERIVTASRQFARRQRTWFRKLAAAEIRDAHVAGDALRTRLRL